MTGASRAISTNPIVIAAPIHSIERAMPRASAIGANARRAPSSLRGPPTGPASGVPARTAISVSDPRIDVRVDEVDDQAREDDDEREHDDDPLHRGVVAVLEIDDQRVSDSGPVEGRLGEDGAGQQ